MKKGLISLLFAFLALSLAFPATARHKNFKVSVYVRAFEVDKMKDTQWLESTWKTISSQLDVDKIYLETHRDMRLVDDATLDKAKKFFEKQGIEVAGGITYTISEPNDFETFSYSNLEDRAWVQKVAEHTARHFDEFLLDDFFFTSSKKDVEILAKGDRSWTQYRLELMNEAGRNLVVGPAKAVNPKELSQLQHNALLREHLRRSQWRRLGGFRRNNYEYGPLCGTAIPHCHRKRP